MSYKRGGGVLRDLGCHGIDVLAYITGASRFRVQESTIEWDHETDRQVMSEFTLSGIDDPELNECPVEFSVSWLSEQDNHMIFEFDHAAVRAGIRPESELEVASPIHKAMWTRLSLDITGARSSYQAFFQEWQDIVCALRTGQPGELSAASSLLTTGIVDELYRLGGGR
jgi:predicted dehydrogenase